MKCKRKRASRLSADWLYWTLESYRNLRGFFLFFLLRSRILKENTQTWDERRPDGTPIDNRYLFDGLDILE